eukprot:2669468-Rhodomonas_salina.8
MVQDPDMMIDAHAASIQFDAHAMYGTDTAYVVQWLRSIQYRPQACSQSVRRGEGKCQPSLPRSLPSACPRRYLQH